MTATTLPSATDARLAEVTRQLVQVEEALRSGAHGWAEDLQDARRCLMVEAADLHAKAGNNDDARRTLLNTLALGA